MRKPLRPYLFNAYYNYYVDNGETVFIHVDTTYPGVVFDEGFREFIDKSNGQICFNISPRALGSMEIGDHLVIFKTRLKGEIVTVYLPMGSIVNILSPTMKSGILLPDQEYYDRIRHENELDDSTLTIETDDEADAEKTVRFSGGSGDDEIVDEEDDSRHLTDGQKKSPGDRKPFTVV